MTIVHTDPRTIQKTWELCREAYAVQNHRLEFPKNTDPRKTYQWRYAAKLADKFDEWDFDAATSRIFIRMAIEYQKERRLLRKGLAAFFQSNILDIVYQKLTELQVAWSDRLDDLSETQSFLDSMCNVPLREALVLRESFDKSCNIVEWYQRYQICDLFLAVSKSCTVALDYLAKSVPEQRSVLPSKSELFLAASGLDKDFCAEAKQILGDDWRNLWQR